MASIRQLKKEIDSMVFELISDCLLYSELFPEKEKSEIGSIITDAVNLRNDLIQRINHPEGNTGSKESKVHYQKINKDLFNGVDGLCKRLSSISKAKK